MFLTQISSFLATNDNRRRTAKIGYFTNCLLQYYHNCNTLIFQKCLILVKTYWCYQKQEKVTPYSYSFWNHSIWYANLYNPSEIMISFFFLSHLFVAETYWQITFSWSCFWWKYKITTIKIYLKPWMLFSSQLIFLI